MEQISFFSSPHMSIFDRRRRKDFRSKKELSVSCSTKLFGAFLLGASLLSEVQIENPNRLDCQSELQVRENQKFNRFGDTFINLCCLPFCIFFFCDLDSCGGAGISHTRAVVDHCLLTWESAKIDTIRSG